MVLWLMLPFAAVVTTTAAAAAVAATTATICYLMLLLPMPLHSMTEKRRNIHRQTILLKLTH